MKTKKLLLAVALICTSAHLLIGTFASAQSGSLDTTFGSGGKVTTDF